mgnify:CR=1 FL=1
MHALNEVALVDGNAHQIQRIHTEADRRGIPKQELGRCVRCNVQIDGNPASQVLQIVAATTGISAIIAPDGRELARTEWFSPAEEMQTLPANPRAVRPIPPYDPRR